MPYTLETGDKAREVLDKLADVLVRPRDLAVDVPVRHGGWTPAPGSVAENDLTERLVSNDTENSYLVSLPAAVASIHAYTGTHYLAGIAALLREREVLFSPGALARAAFANGVRGMLVLDPRSPTARGRIARALLDEIVSASHAKRAFGHLVGKADDLHTAAARRFDVTRDLAERAFASVEWSGDPHAWRIESEAYPRITAAAQSWSEWRSPMIVSGPTPIQTEGFYDALCFYSHPLSFSGRMEAVWGPDVDTPHMATEVDVIARLTLGAHAAVFDALRLVWDYQGWTVPELDEVVSAANAVLEDASA